MYWTQSESPGDQLIKVGKGKLSSPRESAWVCANWLVDAQIGLQDGPNWLVGLQWLEKASSKLYKPSCPLNSAGDAACLAWSEISPEDGAKEIKRLLARAHSLSRDERGVGCMRKPASAGRFGDEAINFGFRAYWLV
ncbi:hypothetical protein DFH06DRAFT_1151347 [Mycena polygramma]|nr:hypothetical protein DFH06DRAFT_1151347 [Mycena polygramma]